MGTTNTGSTETKGTGTGNNGNTDSSAAKSGGRARGRGRGTTSTTVAGEKDVGLVDVTKQPKTVTVDVPGTDKKDEAKPATPARGRPRGSTTTTRKPAAKKSVATSIDAAQVSMFIQTMSAVVATRPNMSAFLITKDEADQLATPLANIISKNEAIAGVAGEYADHLTLLIAAITIFIPKFLMFKMQRDAAIAQLPKINKEVNHDKTTTASRGTDTATRQDRDTSNVQDDGHTNADAAMHYIGAAI